MAPLIPLMPAPQKTGPQLVIDVEDIEQMLTEIKSKGGEVISSKTEIPGGHGYYAVFKDPNGNYLQIHARQ